MATVNATMSPGMAMKVSSGTTSSSAELEMDMVFMSAVTPDTEADTGP